LDNYGLKRKIVGCVNDEGFILNNMTITLKSVVSCVGFGRKFSRYLFWSCILKIVPYATIHEIFAKV
jgi:hypothetical protein